METRASNRAKQKLLSKVVAVDDFGDAVYRCHFTGRFVWPDEARHVGPFLTSVSGVYVAHRDSQFSERESRRAFDEMDRNCNTCQQLVRLPSDRRAHAPLRGRCHLKDEIAFWPDDPMHMACWEQRPPRPAGLPEPGPKKGPTA